MRFGRFMAVTRREFSVRVRTRWFLVSTLLVPALLIASLLAPIRFGSVNAASRQLNLMVVDGTTTRVGRMVASQLNRSGAFVAGRIGANGDPDAVADSVVRHGGYAGAIVIGDGLLQTGAITVVSNGSVGAADLRVIEVAAADALRVGAGQQSVGVVEVMGNLRPSATLITLTGGGSFEARILFGFALWFVLYIGIMIYGMGVMGAVVEEKSSQVVELLLSSLTPQELLAGKIVGVGLAGALQMLIWWVFSALWLLQTGSVTVVGSGWSPGLVALVLASFTGGYLLYAGMFAAVASTVNSETEARQAQFPVLLLLLFPTFVLLPVMQNPGGALAVWLSIVPFSSPVVLPVRWVSGPVPGAELMLSLAVLFGSAGVVTLVAAKIYKIGVLARGSRPSPREVLRWVRSD